MTTTTNSSSVSFASVYQQLRAHLTTLRLHDSAEALPAALDNAAAEKLALTAALERLLAIEVDATQARRLAGRLRFACLPTPATLADFDYDAAAGGQGTHPRTLHLPLPGDGDQRVDDRPAWCRQDLVRQGRVQVSLSYGKMVAGPSAATCC